MGVGKGRGMKARETVVKGLELETIIGLGLEELEVERRGAASGGFNSALGNLERQIGMDEGIDGKDIGELD